MEGDYAQAHVILNDLRADACRWWDIDSDREEYFGALEYIYKSELADVLVSGLDKEAAKVKVLAFLGQIPIECECTEGLQDYRWGENKAFSGSVAAYNHVCDYIFGLAIDTNNKDLASAILRKFKQDVQYEKGHGVLNDHNPNSTGCCAKIKGTWVDGNHSYVYFTNESIDNAREKYNKAIQNGLI